MFELQIFSFMLPPEARCIIKTLAKEAFICALSLSMLHSSSIALSPKKMWFKLENVKWKRFRDVFHWLALLSVTEKFLATVCHKLLNQENISELMLTTV